MESFERIRLDMTFPRDSPLVQSEASDAERDSKPGRNGNRNSLYVRSFSHAVIKFSDENIISPNDHNYLAERTQLSRRTITIISTNNHKRSLRTRRTIATFLPRAVILSSGNYNSVNFMILIGLTELIKFLLEFKLLSCRITITANGLRRPHQLLYGNIALFALRL